MGENVNIADRLAQIVLKHGNHKSVQDGLCAMEAVAWLAGEQHSDAPRCACPALTRYVIRLNDRMDDENRQKLKAFLPRLIGTRDGREKERAELLVWSSILVFTPHVFRKAGMPELADLMLTAKGKTFAEAQAIAREARGAALKVRDERRKKGYTAAAAAAAAAYAAYAAAAARKAARAVVSDLALAALDRAIDCKPLED